jgi:hypothetical protein
MEPRWRQLGLWHLCISEKSARLDVDESDHFMTETLIRAKI